MITLKDIKKAINSIISNKFPDVEIMSTDVKEGFNRPSFFVQLDNVTKDDRLYYFTRDMTVRIYYFPSDRYNYNLEVLDVVDGLESIFNLNFNVSDRVITIDNTSYDITDGVLEFDLEFNYTDSYGYEEQGELIEELEYKQN